MDDFLKYFYSWEIKLGISILTVFFSPFYMSITILFILIVIDTAAGGYYAYKTRRFTSKGFKKSLFKLITYFSSILVVRLLEMGISELIHTEVITNLITAYLIVTEGISVLRNLTLLGAPLPSKLSAIIIKQIKNETLDELFQSGSNKQEYIQEVRDIIEYQIPSIRCPHMRDYLTIKLKEWAQFINILDSHFLSSGLDNNELFFYRVTNLINLTMDQVNDKASEAKIPSECIECIKQWHKPMIERIRNSIKEICYLNEPMERKKNLIIEKVIIGLYQTITDIQKIKICDMEQVGKNEKA
jgi:toxin secretion/phage lysis holin